MKHIGKTIVSILLAPFALVLGLLVFGTLGVMCIPMSIRGHFEHKAWLREMRTSNRTITPEQIAKRGGTGTLIVDKPDWGAKASYCWWTPDDLNSLSPVEITRLSERIESLQSKLEPDDLPLDRWIHENYLSHETGLAYLVTTTRGDVLASQMQDNMVNLEVVETWSAPVAEFGAQNAG